MPYVFFILFLAFAPRPLDAKVKPLLQQTTGDGSRPEVYVQPMLAPIPITVSRSERYLTEFQSGFGVFLLSLPGVTFNAQYRTRIGGGKKGWYAGVDGQYILYTAGNSLLLHPGLWYDFVLAYYPQASLSLGFLPGAAFSNNLVGVPPQTLSLFGEASIAFEMDDLSTLRGQFRPGIVGGRFAFAMMALIGFRFH